jgi:hypothetical protein
VSVRFYLNDSLNSTFTTNNALKQNNGDFGLMPFTPGIGTKAATETIANATVGNMQYYNYAVSSEDVAANYRAGPPMYAARDVNSGAIGEPLFLTEYNKLDIYNT